MRIALHIAVVTVALVGVNPLGFPVPAASGSDDDLSLPSSSQQPNTAVERIRMTETRKGKRLWEVEADRGEMFEDQGKAVLVQVVEPVKIIIYEDGDTLTILSEKLVVDLRTKDLQLSGRVRSESSRGTKMFAERVSWSAEKRQIHTDVPVVIEKEGYQVRGKGMVADTVLERVTIHERITSEIRMSGEEEQSQ